jgi:hypothetical protein
MDSHFPLCELGYHHDRVDINPLVVGIADVDDDLMALYLVKNEIDF